MYKAKGTIILSRNFIEKVLYKLFKTVYGDYKYLENKKYYYCLENLISGGNNNG